MHVSAQVLCTCTFFVRFCVMFLGIKTYDTTIVRSNYNLTNVQSR